MSKLILKTDQVGPWGMNTYALIDRESNQSILFDPGGDPDKLSAMLGDSDPIAIVLTHTHVDHVMALDEMKERLKVPVILHPGPIETGEEVEGDSFLEDGDTLQLGAHTLRAVYAPGHIGNHIALTIDGDDRIIVGDIIFEGGPGKTWTTEGFATTLKSLRNVVLTWSDDAICHPGHGPIFRLGDIREQVEAFLAKDHGDFTGDAEWGM